MIPNDVLGYEVIPTTDNWNKEIEVELGERNTIFLPITNVRYFPQYELAFSDLNYYDVRGNKFSNFDGSKSCGEKKNDILRPVEVPELPEEDETIELDDEFWDSFASDGDEPPDDPADDTPF